MTAIPITFDQVAAACSWTFYGVPVCYLEAGGAVVGGVR